MQDIWIELTTTTFLEIPLSRWMLTAVALFITVVGQRLVLSAFRVLAQRLALKTTTKLDDVLLNAAERPVSLLVLVIGILVAVHLLSPPAEIFPLVELANNVGRVVSIVIGSWFVWRLVDGLSAYFTERAKETASSLDDQLVPFIGKTMKIFLVLTAVLMVAQNMGYSISGLLASLGIGGIAVAMAAKDTIANVFGSIMILVDRPFTVGDWIKASEFEGVVEEVGFRSTKIRTFEKTLVNVPNSSLANMVIDNIDARHVRRIKMRIGLTYSTTPKQMDQAIKGIETILKNHPGVDQEYMLVKFDEFADSSLSIFLYYFSASKVWEEYLQVRQEVNMQIMELLESMELEFAFPSRTVYLHQEGPVA
ncbi:MscS family membrane protein [Mariprofundus ferrinatatus]|uniref:MscS family membrane protein n=1 Tax=Mariprofundus ferrinatatus TaxID=1921087 RepID=A0A2K8L6J5_9PROT|nr:mechanosensitive ion channel family protein [Mariprofundus ferrinatatus]ATX82742.1 MscS family membrane protein [Mariprofundus ferrinatatus]